MANPNMYKLVEFDDTAIGAIETFYSDIDGLAEEAREVVESAPESLKSAARIQTMSDSADTLERIELPYIPDDAPDIKIKVKLHRPKRKADNTSRATRCENAALVADAGISAIEGWIAEMKEAEGERSDDERAKIDEWQTFVDAVREHIAETESVEFPGMRG